MLSLKNGVSLRGMQPQVLLAVQVALQAYTDAGYDLVITSCTDGKHSRGSRHYVGLAVDFRIRHVDKESLPEIYRRIKEALGTEYDVILEKTHIHVEYDPEVHS